MSPSMPWISVIEWTTRGPAGRPLELHEDADRHDDLVADGLLGQLDATHHHHRLEPAQQLARRVGVHRGHGTGVAGVHGLEHVQRLGATALTDDDAVGPHTQGVADEVADADLAAALGVGRPGLQRHDVRALDLEFGRLLDRDEALARRG